MEREIDQLVYDLHELTPVGVEIVKNFGDGGTGKQESENGKC